jgi:hypothetical protein
VRTKRTKRTKSRGDRMICEKNAQKELKELKAPFSFAGLPIISALLHDFDRQKISCDGGSHTRHFDYLSIYEASSTEEVGCFRLSPG